MVNPSPYMIYLQARGSILVASSPEILCRVGEDRTVTNRRAGPAACSLLPDTSYQQAYPISSGMPHTDRQPPCTAACGKRCGRL